MTYWDDLSAALRKKAGENPLVESAIAVLSFTVYYSRLIARL